MARPHGFPKFPHFKQLLRITAAVAVVVTTGCSSQGQNLGKPGETAKAVRLQLEGALGRVQSQPTWSDAADNAAPRPNFASDSISVAWQGDAAVFLNEVARQRFLKFTVTGPQPRMPIYIFVNATQMAYLDLLRDVDKQFGQRANVVLGDGYMELRYR
ncbi:DotD/TraH family lipoprotein [Achromobacter ruhlandii]|uniref:DotD/TraH family lipoprotein n=1 Tax=Achromobacter ruhlandii TaxID=72557 RepID=UPI0007BEDB40|nr:DotD/TraH family lipoprotein [Achromobacter ruhlandii]